MAYLGILLLIVGMAATLLTAKKPRHVLFWSTLAAIVLQSLSFLIFSGILHRGIALLWIAAGLAAGIVAGTKTKLTKQNRQIVYRQNLVFALSYLALLLLNQLIVLFFTAYIPIILFIAALALGMQAGFLAMLLFKAKGIRRTIAAAMFVFCLVLGSYPGASPAYAASDLDISPDEIGIIGVSEGAHTQFDDQSNDNIGYTLKVEKGAFNQDLNGNLLFQGHIQYYNRYHSRSTPYSVYEYETDGSHVQLTYDFQANHSNDPEALLQEITDFAAEMQSYGLAVQSMALNGYPVYRITEVTGLVTEIRYFAIMDQAQLRFDYYYTGVFGPPIDETGSMVPELMSYEQLDDLFGRWMYKVEHSDELAAFFSGQPIDTGDGGGSGAGLPAADEQGSGSNGDQGSGGSVFSPVPVDAGAANLAMGTSGILAGIAGLLTSLAGFWPAGSGLGPAGSGLGPAGSGLWPAGSSPAEASGPPANTPSGSPINAPPHPPVGTRREDGKIFTKNHGWQNEEFPGLQANSLKNTIRALNEDLARYTNSGDNMMAAVIRDELKCASRDLQSWSEDSTSIRKIQSNEQEDMHQRHAKRMNERADSMQTAATAATAVSFAGDLAAAIGTAGISSLFTGAKALGSIRTGLKVLNGISTAKDYVINPAINITDGLSKGKDLTSLLAGEALDKGIGKAVGAAFDAGKKAAGFQKYGRNKSSDAVKAITASAETIAGNLAQNAVKGGE